MQPELPHASPTYPHNYPHLAPPTNPPPEPFDVVQLLEHGTYVEQARTLLIDQQEGRGKEVVLILRADDASSTYTMWPAATFREWAERLLAQLD